MRKQWNWQYFLVRGERVEDITSIVHESVTLNRFSAGAKVRFPSIRLVVSEPLPVWAEDSVVRIFLNGELEEEGPLSSYDVVRTTNDRQHEQLPSA